MSMKPWVYRHPYIAFLLWLFITPYCLAVFTVQSFLQAIGFDEWLSLGFDIWRHGRKAPSLKDELDDLDDNRRFYD